jgi:glucose-1-phosphate cytidylyltransferase
MTLIAPRRRPGRLALPRVAMLVAAGDREAGSLARIGGRSVLWHTMMQLSSFGMHDFVVAAAEPLSRPDRREVMSEDWRVETLPPCESLGAVRDMLHSGPLLVTECAGLSDIDTDDLLSYHRSHGLIATVVAVRPAARFGRLEIDRGRVLDFAEKPAYEQGWVGAGICVLEPGALDYLMEDGAGGLQEALATLAQEGQLMAYKHDSFWGSLETLKDRQTLESLWQSGNPPWKTWA